MGYETVLSAISNTTQTKKFHSEKSFVLKEVSVKKPISKKVITYAIWWIHFQKSKTEALVMWKRMPGIEVLPDGKILYQGKAINNIILKV
jgi:hypothetical protein